MNANGSGAEPQGGGEPVSPNQWFFGLLRESGGYRIVAAGPTEGRVRRAMADQSAPTLIAPHVTCAQSRGESHIQRPISSLGLGRNQPMRRQITLMPYWSA